MCYPCFMIIDRETKKNNQNTKDLKDAGTIPNKKFNIIPLTTAVYKRLFR